MSTPQIPSGSASAAAPALTPSPYLPRIHDPAAPAALSINEEADLKSLLQNAETVDEITPIHLRIKTPPEMTVELLPHQQLGVEWMLRMERGNNKGGILVKTKCMSGLISLIRCDL